MTTPATAWTALAVVLATAAAGCGLVQGAGRQPPLLLSVEDEIELGQAIAPYLEADFGGRVTDPAIQAYVRTVGECIARSTPLHGLPYHFSVLDSGVPAALALPGGTVYVTRGLLERLDSEGELAAALARELVHINARHAGREVVLKFGLPALADVLSGAAPYGQAGVGRRQARLGRIAAALRDLRYDAAVESEADRLGLDYMAAAGYNPASMVDLLEVTTAGGTGWPPAGGARPTPGGRAGAIRRMIARKYVNRGGRVGREEYASEVLDRLRTGQLLPAAQALNGGPS